ncbi:TPA: hypothetical protein ACTCZD_000349 [Neisseria meningitidis]
MLTPRPDGSILCRLKTQRRHDNAALPTHVNQNCHPDIKLLETKCRLKALQTALARRVYRLLPKPRIAGRR